MSLFAGTELYRPPRCERCQELLADCQCPEPEASPLPPDQQTARVQVERRKRGKTVTVIRGLAEGTPPPHLKKLWTTLKNECGAGGTIDDGVIEIQGDHAERIRAWLTRQGYRVR